MGPYHAVPVRMMQPKEVVNFLRARLPALDHLFGDRDELEAIDLYVSCGLLSEEAIRRQDDTTLRDSFCSVVNEMALSHEFWMREALGELLEVLAHDQGFVEKLRPHLKA